MTQVFVDEALDDADAVVVAGVAINRERTVGAVQVGLERALKLFGQERMNPSLVGAKHAGGGLARDQRRPEP